MAHRWCRRTTDAVAPTKRGEGGIGKVDTLGDQFFVDADQIPAALLVQVDDLLAVGLGALGAFTAKDLELRPGTYTVIGSRNGYRDVRQTFTVRPGRNLPPINVVCVEPI